MAAKNDVNGASTHQHRSEADSHVAGRAHYGHDGHGAGDGSDGHDTHAGHAVETFRQKFRGTLLLSIPTVIWAPTLIAPIAGVITERAANPGLNVDTTAKLFNVVDLSTVWVVADLYEKDFSRVRVGASASVITKASPDVRLHSRVSYIDPQLNPETRTQSCGSKSQVPAETSGSECLPT
jgi:hypothetical protein